MAEDFNYVPRDEDTTSNTRKPRGEAVCATIMTLEEDTKSERRWPMFKKIWEN